ncbi:hypothetical protein UGYR_12490 [Yersinia ruckeri]|nr:hypothetical protein UGYR_12490 [Yersinia ruckeri]
MVNWGCGRFPGLSGENLCLPKLTASRLYMFLLDGKPIPENRYDVTVRLSEHINHKSASEIFDDAYFSIRYFQKGTAHITFKRIDLTEKMNDIIAKHYPGMLAAR